MLWQLQVHSTAALPDEDSVSREQAWSVVVLDHRGDDMVAMLQAAPLCVASALLTTRPLPSEACRQ